MLTLSRTKKHSWSSKQGKIFLHKAISLARAVWALYLFIRKCSRPKAHSYVASWGTKDCACEIAFPNKVTPYTDYTRSVLKIGRQNFLKFYSI